MFLRNVTTISSFIFLSSTIEVGGTTSIMTSAAHPGLFPTSITTSTTSSLKSSSRLTTPHDIFVPSNSSETVPRLFLPATFQSHQQSARTYNWPSLFLLSCIALVAFCGNVLVCLAVCCKRKLQSMFNCFLVSLAISDMMSAILVMPLSILRTSVEPLPLPKFVCVTWYCLDVLFTSSTICHLCMISIDRYLTLTFPLRYGRTRKRKKQTIAKLAVVWVISMSIAGPLFILNMMDSSSGEDELAVYKGCGPENPTFVISSTVISFYLPLLIMTVMYALTVRALQQQLREQRRIAVTNSVASSSISGPSSSRGGQARSKFDRRPWRSLRVKYDSGSQSEKILPSKSNATHGRKVGHTRQVFGSMSTESSNDSVFKRWVKKVYDMTSKKSAIPNVECLPNLEELLGTSEYSSLANASAKVERREYTDGKSLGCYVPSGGETSRVNASRAIKMDCDRMGSMEERRELTSPESLRAEEFCTPTPKSSSVTYESSDAERSIMSMSLMGANLNNDHFSETAGLIQNMHQNQRHIDQFPHSSEVIENSMGSLFDASHREDVIITISNSESAELKTSPTPSITSLEILKEFNSEDQNDAESTKKPAIIYDTPDYSKPSKTSSTKRQGLKSGSNKSSKKTNQDRTKCKNTKSKNSTSRDIVTPIITVDLADESPSSADSSECYNVALDLSVYAGTSTTTKVGEISSPNTSFETTTFIASPSKSLKESETIKTEVEIPQVAQKGIQRFPPIKQLSLPLKRKSNSNENKYLNPDTGGICLTPSKLLLGETLREGDEGTGCTLSVPELSSLKIRHRGNSLLDINYNNRLPTNTQRRDTNRRLTSTSLSAFNTPLRHRLSAVSASFGFRPSVCSTGSAGRYGLGCPDKGRRAVQVLGILFAVFVVCYLPFFAVYLVNTTCIRCREYISSRTLAALEWLGYTGSLLNPIIYHIFSPDFRLAFHDLIRCRCCRQKKRRNLQPSTCTSKSDTSRCSLTGKCRTPFCFASDCCRSHMNTKCKQLPATSTLSKLSDFRQSTRSHTIQTQESAIGFDSQKGQE